MLVNGKPLGAAGSCIGGDEGGTQKSGKEDEREGMCGGSVGVAFKKKIDSDVVFT